MYNSNNYGYNPYYQQRFNNIPQQPIQQIDQTVQNPVQNSNLMARPLLNGKQVESIDVVKAMDIPLDGSISYFPIADGSAIVTKQLGMDGVSKTIVYKPCDEPKTVKFASFDDLDDLRDEINDLKTEIKDMKKSKKKED